MDDPVNHEPETYYTQEDLETVWKIMERLGIPQQTNVDVAELRTAMQNNASPKLLTPWGEKVFTLESFQKLAIVFNIKAPKKTELP